MFFLFVCSCRCCVSDRIPASYLEQVRDKYLNYDTRAQRKDFLLSCKDPAPGWLVHCQRVTVLNILHIATKTSTFLVSQEWVFSR